MITIKLTCDLCGAEATGEKCREHDEEKLRAAARTLGWRRYPLDNEAMDLCPRCVVTSVGYGGTEEE